MILCDIGNTTFHFLKISENSEEDFKLSISDNLSTNKLSTEIDEMVYFISVNDEARTVFQKKFPNSLDIGEKFEFKTTYANTLGIDRSIACKFISNGIIVDFGSAITIDVMQNNAHLGGFIMLGFETLKRSYSMISKKLIFDFQENINIDDMPTNTNEAISSAIIKMIVLPIKEIQKKYNLKLIITGETSKIFLKYFDDYEFRDRLIFDNMKKIIEEKKWLQ